MKTLLLIFFGSLSTIAFSMHPVHFSAVNMELEKDSLEITYSIRVFQEDFISLISLLYDQQLHHAKPTDDPSFDTTLIPKYFNQALVIKADGTKLKPEFLGKKTRETDMWVYFKVHLASIPNEIAIKNEILLNLFIDQTNLLIFSCGNNEKGLTFDATNTEQLLKVKNIL